MTDTVDVGAQVPHVTSLPGQPAEMVSSTASTGLLSLSRPPSPPRRTWAVSYQRTAVVLDVTAAALSAVLAALLSGVLSGLFGEGHEATARLFSPTYLTITVVAPFAWVAGVALSRGYERRFMGVGTEEFRALARAAVRLLAITGFMSYAVYSQRPFLSRWFVVVFFPILLGVALLLRFALRKHLHRRRSQGKSLQRTVVVGRADSVIGLIHELRRVPSHGLEVVAACTSSLDLDAEEPSSVIGVQMLGSVRTALDAVDLVDAEVVVVASHSEMTGPELRRLSWGLESRNVDLVVSPGIIEVAGPRLSIRPAAGLSLLHVERPTVDGGRLLGKIIFDRVMSVLISLLILPVALVVALAIKVDSRGPVFFRQDRIGARGEPFEMFKFRSMVVDAEARLADVSAQGNDGNGVLFKQRNDPRVTRVGQFIRRYSLDELPQLINVLKGDMSLVGPRPPLRSEVEGYEPDAVRRLRVRPGLTGLWQVSGRSDLSWDESLRLDLRYVDNWSMILDLQILWRTARAVLRGSGAY
ncbi:sugar transferase [Segeticoccus rhizosphaerae]|jgi:exopolysaccharide biosynthesis polyprenyl glycosylphosphotransferase|uniref:sugar transferase n=1 Tax=Segeticoccus rhizosphaerae TaxID=1104777 RepID=UPI00138FD841|nr:MULTISPECIES: sugar transferase [Intrasporangiaceae]